MFVQTLYIWPIKWLSFLSVALSEHMLTLAGLFSPSIPRPSVTRLLNENPFALISNSLPQLGVLTLTSFETRWPFLSSIYQLYSLVFFKCAKFYCLSWKKNNKKKSFWRPQWITYLNLASVIDRWRWIPRQLRRAMNSHRLGLHNKWALLADLALSPSVLTGSLESTQKKNCVSV